MSARTFVAAASGAGVSVAGAALVILATLVVKGASWFEWGVGASMILLVMCCLGSYLAGVVVIAVGRAIGLQPGRAALSECVQLGAVVSVLMGVLNTVGFPRTLERVGVIGSLVIVGMLAAAAVLVVAQLRQRFNRRCRSRWCRQ